MKPSQHQRAKHCQACGLVNYPRITPAMTQKAVGFIRCPAFVVLNEADKTFLDNYKSWAPKNVGSESARFILDEPKKIWL